MYVHTSTYLNERGQMVHANAKKNNMSVIRDTMHILCIYIIYHFMQKCILHS